MWLIDKMALMNPHYRLMCLILCWPVLVSAQDPSTDIAIGGSNLLPDAMNPNLFIIGEAGGTRPGAGVNLIHSLDRFDLNSADTARFTADPLPTDNIIARVTGGDISTIWGTIEMDVAGANLFFLNPAGIVFGPTATLNVQGGFHASTADTVSLDNGMGNTLLAFSGDAALAMAHPVAFGFLNAPMGTITVDGASLNADAQGGLSLVGGDVRVINDAGIIGNQAALALASVSQTSDVDIVAVQNNGLRLAIDPADAGGSIQLMDAEIDLVGASSSLQMLAANVELRDSDSSSFTDIQLRPANLSDAMQAGGDIDVRAQQLTLDNVNLLTRGGAITIAVDQLMATNSRIETQARLVSTDSDIHIQRLGMSLPSRLQLQDDSIIGAGIDPLSASNAAGDITITGFDTIALSGERSSINTDVFGGFGVGGSIRLSLIDHLQLTEQAQIRSDARGSGALAGEVDITARLIELSRRAEISTAAFLGANTTLGPSDTPGGVTVSADEIHLRTGGSIESISVGAGDGGDVRIDTRILTADGGQIALTPGEADDGEGATLLFELTGSTPLTVGFMGYWTCTA